MNRLIKGGLVAVGLWLTVATGASAATVSGFMGDFDHANWISGNIDASFAPNGGNGFVLTGPSNVEVFESDTDSGEETFTYYGIGARGYNYVASFDWTHSTGIDECCSNARYYTSSLGMVTLGEDAGGFASVFVDALDFFAFVTWSEDDCCGRSISEFETVSFETHVDAIVPEINGSQLGIGLTLLLSLVLLYRERESFQA